MNFFLYNLIFTNFLKNKKNKESKSIEVNSEIKKKSEF